MKKQFLSQVIDALAKGKIIVYPTDTLYGLGADIFNIDAIKKIYKIKKRPENLPISIAVSSISDIRQLAYVDDKVEKIIKKFLPGELTIVLRKKSNVLDILTNNKEKIAIRIPKNKIALEILSNYGPLTCTSANIHGQKTPSLINDINMQFKKSDIALYIDNGKLNGAASTIVDLTNDKPLILREGNIKEKEIMDEK